MNDRTLRHLLRPFAPHLTPDTIEIVVNRQNEFGVETREGWSWYEADLPYDICEAIGILSAYQTGKDFSPLHPIVTSRLPGGQRIHCNQPPVTRSGIVSINIRVPDADAPTMERLAGTGMFAPPKPTMLLPLPIAGLDAGLAAKLTAAVRARKNILISGATNSGKTTLAQALIATIPPTSRIVTIEDAPEWNNVPHRNRVALYYDADGGLVTSDDLLRASLRMRPDRVLMGELRGGEAWTYLRSTIAGHPGCITTLHADSAEDTLPAARGMMREHPSGRTMRDADIAVLLARHVDVVVHLKRDEATKEISVTGVYER